jgi:TonB-linked SusC/RagA family outer membrane protein
MLIFTLIVGSVFAQTTKITGKITDEKGEPLLGVTVVIKETSKGAISDLNGYFAIEANNNDILIFSMIGYTTEEVRLNGNRFLNIVLKEKVTELQNIVVIGYGTSAKKDLTGAVSVIKGDELSKMPVGSVANILQGKTPGVSVSSSSGTPGAPAVVRIRGISSINGSNTPLYIVDGLPQNNIDYLNPSDIETVVVHKDASVAAIYGARGANGIIMITTKSGGSKEKINVNYDSYVGIQAPWKRPYMLSAREFIEYKNLSYANAGLPTLTEFSTPENIASVMNFVTKNSGPKGTDWWKEITNYQALLQNHNISISGGSKKVNILSSLAYLTEEGIVKGSEYQRLSWRNNLNAEISDRIKFTAIFGIVNENRKVIDENNPATGTIFSAMTADPITPVFRNNLVDVPLFYNNIYNGYDRSNIYSHYAGIMYSNKRNPVAQIERMRQSKYGTFSLKSGGNLEIILIDALKFNSRFGLDMAMGQTEGFQPYYTISPSDYSSTNTVISNSSTTRYIVFENTLNYDKKIGEYKFGALIGTSAESTHSSSVNASIQGIVNNNPEMRILNAGTINPSVSGYPYSNALLSYFGRLTADYRNKYLLAFNLRRDGSSRFAKENRWGTFPSVSAAWRFSSENFM